MSNTYGFNIGDKVEKKTEAKIGVIIEIDSKDVTARVKWLRGDPEWVRLINLRRL